MSYFSGLVQIRVILVNKMIGDGAMLGFIWDVISLPFNIISGSLECLSCCVMFVIGSACMATIVAVYMYGPFA